MLFCLAFVHDLPTFVWLGQGEELDRTRDRIFNQIRARNDQENADVADAAAQVENVATAAGETDAQTAAASLEEPQRATTPENIAPEPAATEDNVVDICNA